MRSGTSLPASYSPWFLKKNISLVIMCIKWQSCIDWLPLRCEILIKQYVYCNYLLTRLWCHKFWSKPDLSNKAVFSTWSKFEDKNLNILVMKRAFKLNKNFSRHFWRTFVEANKTIFLESQSQSLISSFNNFWIDKSFVSNMLPQRIIPCLDFKISHVRP